MSGAPENNHLRIDPTAHIADKASLHTSTHHPHPIVIGAHCVVHPYARLDSSSGPIAIGDGCVIWEKAVIGSPRGSSRPSSATGADAQHDSGDDDERLKFLTIMIGDGTIIQPHAKVPGPATIRDRCNLGVAAEIGAGAVLGEGVTVTSGSRVEDGMVLEKGTVLYGDGRIRRPGRGASDNVQNDLLKARELREEGEEKHRALMTKLVKGTAGGTRFTG